MSVPDTTGQEFYPTPVNWLNLAWLALVIAIMIAVIVWGNLWALNFLHVLSGLLWTGIDLFMGFVVGPILRQTPFTTRREVMTRLTPRTMFILPGLAIITGTTGWYLAINMGMDMTLPDNHWLLAALIIVTILTIQGIGYLLPTQIRVYRELCKPNPDGAKIARLSKAYFWVIASQGVMQVLIVVIMAKFRVGV